MQEKMRRPIEGFCEKAMNFSVGRLMAVRWWGFAWLLQAQQFLDFYCLRIVAWGCLSLSLCLSLQ